MRILIMAPVLSCLMLGPTFQSSCMACEEEIKEYESPKKRQRVRLTSLPEPSFIGSSEGDIFPEELLLSIFDQLSFRDLSNVQKVCRHWHTLGRDDTLSLTQQILRKPLSEVLWKLEAIKDELARLEQEIATLVLNQATCQRFFASPDAFCKLLLAPTAIEYVLRTCSLIHLLLESDLTASEIYQALHTSTLDKDQQSALKAYAKAIPVFPFQQNIFSEEFVNYAKTYSPHYKAFYLLSFFNILTGKPMKDLLKRINHEVISEETYENTSEAQAIFIPRGMAYFTDLSSDIAYNIGEYSDKWAEQITNEITKGLWLSFAEFFFRKSANQGDVLAQCNLGLLLLEKGKLDEAEAFLRQSANQGEISAQCGLGSLLHEQGKFKEAEAFLRVAASQGDGTAQCNLGALLEEQGKLGEAETFYRQSASQGDATAQCSLGLLLRKLRKFEEAEDFLRQAVNQGDAIAQYYLGFYLEKKGNFEEAIANYEKAVKQDFKFACLNLAYLLKAHPEVFKGSQEELSQRIAQLREQGKSSLEKWSKAWAFK